MKDFTSLNRRGFMLIFSSPSGAGKTTICQNILKSDPRISLSISATTRPMRPGEENGVHYHFKTEEEFKAMIDEDAFLEWAHVFGHYYGTLKEQVYQDLQDGKDILFDIDWQGAQQIKEVASEDVVTVFVLPPSREELEKRLLKRAQDSKSVIEDRMEKANGEISHYTEYKYIIINHDLETSIDKVEGIIKSERLMRRRLTGLNAFVRNLMSEADPTT